MVFRIFFLLFLFVPLVEIYLLIQVGRAIGALPTIFLVVLTALAGAFLLRHQGFLTLRRVQAAAARGEPPTMAMLEGAVVLVSGVLLLVPGFFTDALGLLGLVPPLRRFLIVALLRRGLFGPGGRPPGAPPGPRVIEGEFRRDDD